MKIISLDKNNTISRPMEIKQDKGNLLHENFCVVHEAIPAAK